MNERCININKDKEFIPNKTSVILGKNIVYFRQLPENQWSQYDLAQKMNSDKGYLSRIENARRNASTDYIDRLCRVFNIEPEELFKIRDIKLKSRIDSRK